MSILRYPPPRVFSLISGVFIALALILLPLSAQAGTGWESGETSLAGMSLDGSPAVSFGLGALGGSPEFAFPMTLEHRVEAKAEKLPLAPNVPANAKPEFKVCSASEWEVPQLRSRLLPEGHDYLSWQQPSGGHVWFKTALISRNFSAAGSADWEIAEAAPAVYEIRHRENGLRYRYSRGQLMEISHEVTGRALKITSVAGCITRIEQKEVAKPLLEASYDAAGHLMALTIGPVSHRFTWNGEGRLASWNSGLTSSTNFAYQTVAPDHALLSGLTLPDGTKHAYTWTANKDYSPSDENDALGKPYVLSAAGDLAYSFAKTQRGYELSASGKGGKRQSLIFNPVSGLLQRTAADGSTIAAEHRGRQGGDSLLRKVTGPEGVTLLDLRYDTAGRVVEKVAFGAPVEIYRYDAQGRLVEVLRNNTRWTAYAYESALRRPTRVMDAMGAEIQVRYDAQGQPSTVRDPDGNVHRFTYDMAGRPLGHELPTGHQRKFTYDVYGRISERVDADGSRLRLRFNALGLVAAAETASAFGAVHTWDYTYDALARPTALQRDGKSWQAWERAPLPNGGERITSRDPLGQRNVTDFDAEDRLLRQENALGEELKYQYDVAGQLSGWQDERGALASFQRDLVGRVVGQTDALGHGQSWNFDKMGRLTQRNNGEQNISYTYDDQGRPTTINYGVGQTVGMSYDAAGNMTEAKTDDATLSWKRDALGRPVARYQRLADGTASGVAWEYTASGLKKAVALIQGNGDVPPVLKGKAAATSQTIAYRPGETFKAFHQSQQPLLQVTEYKRDALNRITAIVVNGKEKVSCTFDEKTLQLSEKRFASGLRLKYAYDAEGNPSGLLAITKDGKPIRTVTYRWNDVGQLIERKLTGFSEKGKGLNPEPLNLQPLVQTYTYDALGRLSKVECPAAPELSEHYIYDQSGNIIERTSGGRLVKMTYDKANQLVSSERVEATPPSLGFHGKKGELTEFTYDKAGRMTREKSETLNLKPSTATYTYGYLDKVLKVDRDGQTAQFHYGADGMLLGKTKNGQTESWTWDGLALLSRGDETYVNEPHLTGGVPIIATRPKMKQTALGATKAEGDEADEILLSDYLGTTLDTLDSEETTSSLSPPPSSLNSTGLLTSYGGSTSSGLESSSPPSSVSPRFTGKPYDADLGAHVFPFRNYRSDTGGWTTADPSGFPDGPNQHYYAPVATSGLDVYGLFSISKITPDSPTANSQGSFGGNNYAFTAKASDLVTLTGFSASDLSALASYNGYSFSNASSGMGSATATIGFYGVKIQSDPDFRGSFTVTGQTSQALQAGYSLKWVQLVKRNDESSFRVDGSPFYSGSNASMSDAPDLLAPMAREANSFTARSFLVATNGTNIIAFGGVEWNIIATKQPIE
ncbi:hypothetical protein BH11VER1_BH11VER1_32230 [soil metagenome]